MKVMTKHSGQRGFSLVEIMVALSISALLVAGIIQIFIGSKQTYRIQENLSRLQENGRFAIEFLSRDIRMAGFSPLGNFAGTAITGCDGGTCVPGVTPPGALSDGAADTIALSYESARDCLGSNVPTPPGAVNIFHIQNANLRCRGNGNRPAQPLIEGVDDMQILYGLDTDNDRVANRYIVASNLDAGNIRNVVSVRITLRLQTPEDNLSDTVGAQGDRRLRRIFTTTIALRNRTL